MAYVQNDKVELSYNDMVNLVNTVYSDVNMGSTTEATANFGYGFAPVANTVSVGDKITAAQWTALLTAIHTCADHQGTDILVPLLVSPGDKVSILSDLTDDITKIVDNRLNIDVAETTVSTLTSHIRSNAWDTTVSQVVTVTFSDWDEMRYFFNTGGNFQFAGDITSHTNNTTDLNWENMMTSVTNSTVLFDSTKTYSAIGSLTGTYQDIGFYDLTTTFQNIFQYIPAGYSSEVYRVTARLGGAPGTANTIDFNIDFDTPAGGDINQGDINSIIYMRRANGPIISVPAPTGVGTPIT